MNNTALVRIKKEYDLIRNDSPDNFNAFPIKDDLFTWHFTIRGADETDFENGIYHGVIKLPTSYPLKPPSIMFLTPNGRFDTNVDVCLSVTKFHKEEWQAAWTIRTILEAIIAFFPIKEGHEAIGAIDYPSDARKKLAVQSRKWKCDICGPIIELVPDKKPRKESISQDKKDEKEDNKSDSSINSSPSVQLEKSELENKQPKKTKLKKIEIDRKSHLSNIEGVIFEDVNEYAENEEENDLSVKRNLTDLGNEKTENRKEPREIIERLIKDSESKKLKLENTIEINKESKIVDRAVKTEKQVNHEGNLNNLNNTKSSEIINSHNELKRSHSDINPPHGNFSDYLRNLRQSQFEPEQKQENIPQSHFTNPIKTDKLINESEPEINFKQKEKIEINYKPPYAEEINESQTAHEESTKIPPKQTIQTQFNTLKELTKEEIEFYDIFKSVRLHNAKSQEEVMKEILEDKINELTSRKKERENIIEEMLSKIFSKELAKSEEGKQIINNSQENSQENVTNNNAGKNSRLLEKQKILDMVNILKDKDKIESLMKQKNNALKYITGKTYQDLKKRDLRWVNFFMVILVILTFGVYYYSKNYM